MNKNENTITFDKISEIKADYFPDESVVDYHGEELIVKRVIPFNLFCLIVRHVTDLCFNPETMEYMPEKLEFAIRLCVADAYTNISFPGDTEEQYGILYGTDLWDVLMDYISTSQYADMCNAIHSAISVRNNANRAMFEREIQMITSQVEQLGQDLAGIFNGVSANDVKNLVSAIGNGGVDEEKIVQAVVAEQNKLRGDASGEVIQFPLADHPDTTEDVADETDGE